MENLNQRKSKKTEIVYRTNFKALLVAILISLLFGALVTIGGFYIFNKKLISPVADPKLTPQQVWAGNHPQQVDWTITRWEKFMEVAGQAFYQEK